MEQKEKGQINSNSEPGTDVVVDYYKKYGIGRNEDYKSIKGKLGKELATWVSKAGSTSRDAVEVLADIDMHINELRDAIILFKPGNEEKRAEYDAKLEQQKKREEVNDDNVKVDGSAREGIKIIPLRDISRSLSANPLSLEYLKEVQRKMARESGNSTEKSDGGRDE